MKSGLLYLVAPANVPPGKPTEGECDEDDFRYFEVTCPVFTETVIIEQLDIVGTCALYVSVEIVNPGPVDPTEFTFRNETITVRRRTLFVTVNVNKVDNLPHNRCFIRSIFYADCVCFYQRNC